MTRVARLTERGVIAIEGADRVAFLQGLVSNDVALAAPRRAVWSALLTPQGKWVADFFILADGGRLLLDCERAQAAMLIQRLSRYRLRSAVRLDDVSDEFAVHVAWNGPPPEAAAAAPDPRLPDAGWRILATAPIRTTATAEDWDRHRLALGLPDGTRDLEPEKTVLLEAGFDELNGIAWKKGCYMGQELTARTKYRGLIKRRLVPVSVAGPLPASGTPVLSGSTEVGAMRSGRDNVAMASLRIDALAKPLACADATLTPRVPAWMALPEAASGTA